MRAYLLRGLGDEEWQQRRESARLLPSVTPPVLGRGDGGAFAALLDAVQVGGAKRQQFCLVVQTNRKHFLLGPYINSCAALLDAVHGGGVN